MRKIYIDFTSPKNHPFPIYSWLVQYVQDTPYSHTRFRWTNSFGNDMVYEAGGSSVRFLGEKVLQKKPVHHHKVYELTLTNEEFSKFCDIAGVFAGLSYGVTQVLGIYLAKQFDLKANPLSKGSNQQICSELVARVIFEVKGWELPTGATLDLAGPREVDLALDRMAASTKYPDLKLVLDKCGPMT